MCLVRKILVVWLFLVFALHGEEKSDKYHRALQRSPFSKQLLLKFFDTYELENEDVELEVFLKDTVGNSWQDRIILAHYQIRMRQFVDAQANLSLVIKQQPKNYEIYYLRAELLLEDLKFELAAADLELIVENAEGEITHKSKTLLSKCYVRMKRVEDAVKIWNEATLTNEDRVEFVETAESEGEIAEAAKLCKTLIEKTKDPYKKTRYSLKLGKLNAKAGENDEALEIFVKALEKTGTGSWIESEILLQCDSVLRRAGNVKEELAFYDKLEKAHPRRVAIIKKHATLLAYDDQWDASLQRFNNLIKSNPTDLDLREEFISFLENLEKNEEALGEIDDLLKLTGYKESLLVRKISLLKELKKEEEIKAIIDAIASNLTDKQVDQIKLAQLHLENGYKEEGEKLLKARLANDENFEVHKKLAEYLLKEDRDDEALKLYTKVAKEGKLNEMLQVMRPIENIKNVDYVYDLMKPRQAEFTNELEFLVASCDYAYRTDNFEEAVPLALKLVKYSKGHLRITNSIRTAIVLIKNAEKFDEVLKEIAIDQSTQMLCLKAEIWAEKEDLQKAEEVLERALEQKSVIEAYVWSDILARDGDIEKSIKVLESLRDTEQGKSAVYLRKLSYQQYAAKKYKETLKTIDKWKAVAPKDKQAWLFEYKIFIDLKQRGKAIQNLRKAIVKFEDPDEFEQALGVQYLLTNRSLEALDLYWKAFEHAISDDTKLQRADRLISFGVKYKKLEELKKRFIQKHEDNPKSIVPLVALAKLYEVNEDLEQELNALQKVIKLKKDSIVYIMRIAEIYEASGDLVQAEATIKDAAKEDVNGVAGSQLIRFYLRIGKSAEAIAWVEKIMENSSPRDAQQLALYLYHQDYWVEAEGILESAVRRYPEDMRLHYVYASILEDRRNYKKALKHFLVIYDLPRPKNNIFVIPQSSQHPKVGYNAPVINEHQFYYNSMATAYRRNFYLNQASTVMMMPSSYNGLLALTDIHVLTLCKFVEMTQSIERVINKRLLGNPDQIFNLLQLTTVNDSNNGDKIKEIISGNLESRIAYQVAMQTDANNIDLATHIFAFENYKDSPYLMNLAVSKILVSPDKKYFEKVLKYYDLKVQQGVPAKDLDWYNLYVAMLDSKNIRSDGEKNQLKKLILKAIDQYQKMNPQFVRQQHYVLKLLVEFKDEERMVRAINSWTKDKIYKVANTQDQTSKLLQWLNNLPHDRYFRTWKNYNRGWSINLNGNSLNTDDGVKKFIMNVAQKVEDPIYRAYLYDEVNEIEKVREILQAAIDQSKESKEEAVFLLGLLDLDQGDFEKTLRNIEKYSALYGQKSEVSDRYAYLALIAFKNLNEEKSKPYNKLIESVLVHVVNNIVLSPWHGSQPSFTEIAKRLGKPELVIPKPGSVNQSSRLSHSRGGRSIPVKKTKPEENERLKKARALISVAQRAESHKRIEKYKESGKEERAVDLSVRLLIRYFTQNEDRKCKVINELLVKMAIEEKVIQRFLALKAHNLPEAGAIFNFLNESIGTENTAQFINNQFVFLADDKKAIQDFLGMKNLEVFKELLEGKHKASINLLINRSKDLWYHYHYNLCKTFVEAPLEGKSSLYINRVSSYAQVLETGAYFRDGGRIDSALSLNNKEPYKVAERIKMLEKVIEALLQTEHGAQTGFGMAVQSESNSINVKGDRLVWAKQALVSGLLESDLKKILEAKKEADAQDGKKKPVVNLNMLRSNSHRYGQHSAPYSPRYLSTTSITEVIYTAIRNDGDKSFPLIYLKELEKKSPQSYSFLKKLLSLKDLRGEKFAQNKEKLIKEYSAKIYISNSKLEQFKSRIDRLIPYSKKKFDADVVDILEEFELIKKDPKKHEVHNMVRALQSKVRRAFEVAIEELEPNEVTPVYVKFLKKEIASNEIFKDKGFKNIVNILGMSSISAYLVKDDDHFIAVVDASWKHHLDLSRIESIFLNKFQKTSVMSAESAIKVLDAYGYFKSGKEYSPLLINRGVNHGYDRRYSLPSKMISTFYLKTEAKKELYKILVNKKRDTLGGAILGAFILPTDKRDEAVEYLLTEYADELLALDEFKLDAIFSYLNLDYTSRLSTQPKGKIRSVLVKHQKMASARLQQRFEMWDAKYSLTYHDEWYSWYSKGGEMMNSAKSIDLKIHELVSDKLLNSYLEVIQNEDIKVQAVFFHNSSTTYKDVVQRFMYVLRNFSGEQSLSALKKMEEVKSIKKMADLGKWKKIIIDNSYHSFLSPYRKYHDENGKLQSRSLKDSDELNYLYQELSKLPVDIQEMMIETILLKYVRNTSWTSLDATKLLEKWCSMEARNQLDETLKTIGYLKQNTIHKDEILQKKAIEQLLKYFKKYPNKEHIRDEVFVNVLENSWVTNHVSLLREVYNMDLKNPDADKVLDFRRASFYQSISKSNDKEVLELGGLFIDHCSTLMADDKRNGNKRIFSKSLANSIINLAMKTERYKVVHFLLDTAVNGSTWSYIQNAIDKYLKARSDEEKKSPSLRDFIKEYKKSGEKRSKNQLKEVMDELEQGHFDYTSKDDFIAIKSSVKDLLKLISTIKPEMMIPLLEKYETVCDEFDKVTPKVWTTNTTYFNDQGKYCGAAALYHDMYGGFRDMSNLSQLQFSADFISSVKLKRNESLKTSMLREAVTVCSYLVKENDSANEGEKVGDNYLISYREGKSENVRELIEAVLLKRIFYRIDFYRSFDGDVKGWMKAREQLPLYDMYLHAITIQTSDVSEEKQRVVSNFIEEKLTNRFLSYSDKFNIIQKLFGTKNWVTKNSDMMRLYLESSLSFIKVGNNAIKSDAAKFIKHCISDEDFAKLYGDQYIDAWLDQVTKNTTSKRIISRDLCKYTTRYSIKYNKEDLLLWLIENCKNQIKGNAEIVINLVKYGYFDEAKQLVPGTGRNWNHSDDFELAIDAVFQQRIDEMWRKWKDDPWSCALIHSTILSNYKESEGNSRVSEQLDRLYKVTIEMEGIHPFSKDYLLKNIYSDPYYLRTDEDFLQAYFKEHSSEDYKQSGRSENDVKKLAVYYKRVLARSMALRGDFEPLEELYAQLLSSKKSASLKYDLRQFAEWMNFYVVHLIVNDKDELLGKYHDLVRRNSDAQKGKNYGANALDLHFMFTRMVFELKKHQEVDMKRVFGEDLTTYRDDVVSSVRDFKNLEVFGRLQRSPLWMSAKNESIRRKAVLKFLNYANITSDQKIWLFRRFEEYHYDDLKSIIPGSKTDFFAVANKEISNPKLRLFFKFSQFRSFIDKEELVKAEPLFVELSSYYKERNPHLYARIMVYFLSACKDDNRIDLLEKYAKGTKFSDRYSSQEKEVDLID